MSKSYDLSTSTKWANLADGDHVVKLRAKGAGYGSSSFSNSVTVTKGSAMPAKGDIITIETKQYRVLKTNGSLAEVLAMYNSTDSQVFGSNNTYAGSQLDTYCNSIFYGELSETIKSAIIDKSFRQDSWRWSSTAPVNSHYTGKYNSTKAYYLTLVNESYGTYITRHCYCLSVQDVLDYLDCTPSLDITDTTLTDLNIWKMFWNVTVSQEGKFIWLRSAYPSQNLTNLLLYGKGFIDNADVRGGHIVRPAFQIDLSKIEWTPVGG